MQPNISETNNKMQSRMRSKNRFYSLLQRFQSCTVSPNLTSPSQTIKQITQINIHLIDLQEALFLLSCCPKLQKLSCVIGLNYQEGSLREFLSHPSLDKIGIQYKHRMHIKEPILKIQQLRLPEIQPIHLKQLPFQFPRLVKLSWIKYQYNNQQVTLDHIEPLKQLLYLRQLSLFYLRIKNQTISALSAFIPQLQKLSLRVYSCRDNDTTPIALSPLKSLSIYIDDGNYEQVVNLFPSASQHQIPLDLYFQYFSQELNIKDTFLKYPVLIRKMQGSCPIQFFELIQHKPHSLQQYRVDSSFAISPTYIKEVISNQQQILHLEFLCCSNLGNQSIVIISSLTNLLTLKINGCQLTERGVIYLKKMKKLEVLELSQSLKEKKVLVPVLCNMKKAWKVITKFEWQEDQSDEEDASNQKKVLENMRQLRYLN